MKKRNDKAIAHAICEAAHWSVTLLALMLAVLFFAWAAEVTTPDHPLPATPAVDTSGGG